MRSAACLLALFCGGCAAHAVAPGSIGSNASDAVEVLSAAQNPPGYYPGYADIGLVNVERRRTWLAQNQPRIDEIQNRIAAVRAGRVTPGCIGQDKFTCIASLAQKFAIADYSGDKSVVAAPKYDVNGKPVKTIIEFEAYAPNPDPSGKNEYSALEPPTTFALQFGPDGLVNALRAKLAKDPTVARTQAEYDATDAYETVAALTAKQCPNLTRAEVARWIENIIKPGSASARRRIRRGVAEIKLSKVTVFCGRRFQFESAWADKGYNRYRRDVVGGMFVTVE